MNGGMGVISLKPTRHLGPQGNGRNRYRTSFTKGKLYPHRFVIRQNGLGCLPIHLLGQRALMGTIFGALGESILVKMERL
jgi:hypothetical protein